MTKATDKQVNFINRLLAQKAHTFAVPAFNTMSIRDASDFIGRLLDLDDKPKAEAEKLTPGIYKHAGEIYVVKPNKSGTSLYAKQLIVIGGKRLTDADTVANIEFVYAPGIVRNIRPEEKLSLEEGKELTIRYRRCICCGRRLKDAKSVEKGIGPVCRKLFSVAM